MGIRSYFAQLARSKKSNEVGTDDSVFFLDLTAVHLYVQTYRINGQLVQAKDDEMGITMEITACELFHMCSMFASSRADTLEFVQVSTTDNNGFDCKLCREAYKKTRGARRFSK